MKKIILSIALVAPLVLISSCKKSGEPEPDSSASITLPESYLVIESDSFYLNTSSVQPDPNFNRHQINFSSKAQFSESANDGNTPSTFSLVMTHKVKPTASANPTFTDSRFPEETDVINFYFSFFTGTGHALENKNYLSPSSGTMNYTIESGKFTSTLTELTLSNEADASENITLNSGYVKIDW
ncbi:MAG: hypothetical protein MI810_13885 [Flavobacteriales bacterium]|nr:hypothetical protein [Flavobacteriales bacterium]